MSEVKTRDIAGSPQNVEGNFNNKSALSKPQPEVESDNAWLVHKLGIKLSQEIGILDAYKKIVDAAIAIMGSQYATLQMMYEEPGTDGKLRIVACRGFSPAAEKYWEWVYHYTGSSCGEVLRTRRRVIIPDYRTCDFMQNAPTLPVFIEGGILAAQSTPLYSRAGKLLGIMSTHWGYPHTPPQHHLDLLDILARHTADLIDRTQTVEVLRKRAS